MGSSKAAMSTAIFLTPNTPVLVRHRDTGNICIEKIGKLGGYSWTKEGSHEAACLLETDTWTGKTWSTAVRIHRRHVKQPLLHWVHPKGTACVSDLPTEVMDCPMPEFPELASDMATGTPEVQAFRDMHTAQEEYARILALGCAADIAFVNDVYIVTCGRMMQHNASQETATEVPYDGFVYTLETEHGVFQAGAGKLCLPCIKA